jgi:cystathionine beta-lyase
MKTLSVRMGKGQESAQKIAKWLCRRPEVESVLYPGLESFEGHDIHARQSDGPGAMLSFRLQDGVDVQRLVESTSIWTLAVSLGGIESIITYPAKMTHLPYPEKELERLGIGRQLVRLSVGLEDTDDLITDLENAFGEAKD